MTDRSLKVVDMVDIVTRLDPEWLEDMDPVVLNMHTGNGLLDDAWASRNSLADVDDLLTKWIKKYTSGDHIPLAGSGVSHFDRFYIRKDLPRFDRYLSYWAYDTGVIRRTLKLFGIDASFADTTGDKTHRALDDITAHVEEMRRYREMIRGAVEDAWNELGVGPNPLMLS